MCDRTKQFEIITLEKVKIREISKAYNKLTLSKPAMFLLSAKNSAGDSAQI